ncbi:NADH-quinone oxidoreductase subunit C [Thermoflavimicrobium dichotomicum]|uniref:NADH-quinone oxidoreductase n=1 Tax=Thermoflavimicrobium dichotomicum TaxID=46223 RepID=A0A1I3K206_9BACL|nr:NADH-quinone oxidoreductase subunit C [Thermoflavimicrobium dichotomicum]SFI66340.1 NADH-quinone oxidoreductase subunit C [Thermoflavimicrobium dichotomicum]
MSGQEKEFEKKSTEGKELEQEEKKQTESRSERFPNVPSSSEQSTAEEHKPETRLSIANQESSSNSTDQQQTSINPKKETTPPSGELKQENKEVLPKGPQAAITGKGKPSATPRPRPAAKPVKEEKPLPPSPEQPTLDRYVQLIREQVHEEAVEQGFVNRVNNHLPTLIIQSKWWLAVAELFKKHPDLAFDYVQNYSGVDYETHMEVVIHLYSFTHEKRVCFRIKTDREEARVPSVVHLWHAANWNEREIYDLLGIHFENHPDLKRILLPDHWVGHPLRKDYVPLDKEV